MRHYITVQLFAAAATDITKYVAIGGRARLVGVLMVGKAITGHASNFLDVNVFAADGSTLLWNRDTDSGSDGSTVAGTVYGYSPDGSLGAGLVAAEAAAGLAFQLDAVTEAFKVTTVNAASGVAIDVTLTLILEDDREV